MTINSKALVASGVEIGQAVFMEESQPIDLEFFGRRYLRSGYIEDDASKFDTSIFTDSTLSNESLQTVVNTSPWGMNFANGTFFLTGASGKLETSDGSSMWVERASSFGSSFTRTVTYGDGLYVMSGNDGKIASSPDFITWTQRTSNIAGIIYDVKYANGVFIASGVGQVAVSSDAINWVAKPLNTSEYITSLAFGGSTWVAVGHSGTLETSSDNGLTWVAQTGVFGTSDINSVAFGSSVFIAVADDGKLATSPDGETWTIRDAKFSAANIEDITGDAGFFVAVGEGGSASKSSDGLEWEVLDSIATANLFGVALGGGTLVLAGSSPAQVVKSSFGPFAGSTVAYEENNEHQYIRIS